MEHSEEYDFSGESEYFERITKSRERDREHAKKTRLRKKMGIDGMKQKLQELQNEARIYTYIYIR